MEQTKAGVVVISRILYHVKEGVDYPPDDICHGSGSQARQRAYTATQKRRLRVGTTTVKASPAGQPNPT
jgi:hypothetical protein